MLEIGGKQMANIDNPAGRLIDIIEACRRESKQNNEALPGWARVLGINPNNIPRVLSSIADVGGLATKVDTSIRSIDGLNHSRYVAWIPKFLTPWRNFQVGSGMTYFIQPVDDSMMGLLGVCDDMLRIHRPEPTVSDEQLKSLLALVRELATAISESDLPANLKEFLFKYVEIIDAAISDYRVRGYEGFKSGLERAIGLSIVEREKFEAVVSTTPGAKLSEVLKSFSNIVSTVSNVMKIGETLSKALPWISSHL